MTRTLSIGAKSAPAVAAAAGFDSTIKKEVAGEIAFASQADATEQPQPISPITPLGI